MPPQNPDWVKALKPSGPQGSELLAQERANSDINVDQLSTFLFTKEVLERNDKILKILQADPVFDKEQNYSRGRTDRLEAALARAKALRRLSVKHNWNEEEHHAANDLISEPTPYGLHATMFLKTLEEQGTPAQHKLFLERARKYEIIGCYAQTELGHGSNVRGLETTATWNHEDKTFTIHSPHLTASKWWIGSLGKAANHAVVVAQLILNGKPYGPHPFVVPIRDMKTHEPLPDIHVGDIGPKFGYNTMDNGFLLFNNVKIPHVNMLNRFSGVDPETGKYIRPSNPALIYGTLTFIRSSIVFQSGSVLARGVTIATRYCAVRRQFQDRDADASETGENQVLNYTMVQHRLLPLLASSYALFFTGRAMINLYNANQKRMAQRRDAGDAKRKPGPEELSPGSDHLADLHAISCSLKAFASTTAAEGLEVCRRACGGHGYSAFSGIGSWYADYLPTVTWEGDNYMLTQQVARYLLKSARAVLAGKAPDNGISRIFKEFIRRQDIGAAFDVLDSDQDLVDAFAWRVSFLTFEALKHRDEEKQSWNSLLIDFWRLSTAYAQYQVVKNFHEALQDEATKKSLDPNTLAIMHKLFELFALHNLQSSASEFFTSAATTVRQIQLARTKRTLSLLDEIRPHAVRLVDAWSFPDWQLDSALGRYDGKVYEDLFHRASEVNPVNDIVFDPYPESDVLFRKNGSGPKAKLLVYNRPCLFKEAGLLPHIEPWNTWTAPMGNNIDVDLISDSRILHDAGITCLSMSSETMARAVGAIMFSTPMDAMNLTISLVLFAISANTRMPRTRSSAYSQDTWVVALISSPWANIPTNSEILEPLSFSVDMSSRVTLQAAGIALDYSKELELARVRNDLATPWWNVQDVFDAIPAKAKEGFWIH
ncbi:acyl- oxidase [Fusarium agapanthi]|uniref:acyl-CoA oxidase n=1 Tax=Fusarium agapanthi TaxID=1803897 RepID=A0A9P5E8S4_9HYPO|nr:acyl- oxidase [Fusarium agapanthi]